MGKFTIDPRIIGVIWEKILREKFGVEFDVCINHSAKLDNFQEENIRAIIIDTSIKTKLKEYVNNLSQVLTDFYNEYNSVISKSGDEVRMNVFVNPENAFKNAKWKDTNKIVVTTALDTLVEAEIIEYEESRKILKGLDNNG